MVNQYIARSLSVAGIAFSFIVAFWYASQVYAIDIQQDGDSHRGLSGSDLWQRQADIEIDGHVGQALYQDHCASCHEGEVRAPHREVLETMSPLAMLDALQTGIMKQQAAHLDTEEQTSIVEYLTARDLATYEASPGAVMCERDHGGLDLEQPPVPAGWGYDTKRYISARHTTLNEKNASELSLKWAFAFPDAVRARSQPLVAMGAIFVGSQDGTIYAFDLETGCAHWTSQVSAEVRTAIVMNTWQPGTSPEEPPRLFFGDLLGRVHSMDALTGELLWSARPDDHANATITGAPVIHEGALIVPVSSLENVTAADPDYPCCTFRGSIVALDALTGALKWQHHTIPEPATVTGASSVGTETFSPSGAAVWGSPAIDLTRGLIYHGSGQNYSTPADESSNALFAVDAATGERRWSRQFVGEDAWNAACVLLGHPNCPDEKGPDFDLSASPMLVAIDEEQQLVVVGLKSGLVAGVNPDSGAVVWKNKVGRGGVQGGVHFGMAAAGHTVYVGINDLPTQSDGSRSSDYGFPGVHALDARSGELIWRAVASPDTCDGEPSCNTGVSSAVTAAPGVVFAGHLNGWLRAYDGQTGNVLWEVDTTQEWKAVNGAIARGGSMSGPGPTVFGDYVIANSGYGFSGHRAGNALLVFSVPQQD